MPLQKLSVAVYNRWNDAGLNSSIAKLYPAGDSPGAKAGTTGTPESTSKPRAEYTLSLSPPQKTRGSRRYSGSLFISVWGDTKEGVDAYISSIYDAFVNSESAASNPLSISNGTVLIVDDGSSDVNKVDDNTFRGNYVFEIGINVANSTP